MNNNNSVRINNDYDDVGTMRRNFVYSNSSNDDDAINLRRVRMTFMNAGLISDVKPSRPNASTYVQNKKRMKKNDNENKTKNKKIPWKDVRVKNLPVDPISLNAFKVGEKAVKINKMYMAPSSFRKWARMSMAGALNANGNTILFKNPMTRANVKKRNLEFVVLKSKK